MGNLNLKNTKQEIFDALMEAKEELKQKQSITINVKKEEEQKKQAETIKKAKESVEYTEEPQLSVVCKSVAKMVEEFFGTYDKAKEEFQSIQEAIDIKKKDLRDLYNIDETLLDFSAVVNSKIAWENDFEKKMEEKKKSLDEELQRLEKELQQRKAEKEKAEKEYKAEIEKERKRQEQDYAYEIRRKNQEEEDNWKDIMKAKKEKFDADCTRTKEDLQKREEAIKEHEEKIKEINDKITQLQAKIDNAEKVKEEAVAEAVQKTKKKAEESYGYKERYLKKEHEASESLLQSRLDMVTAENEANKAMIQNLQQKLDKAYAEMKDMAANAVNGAAIQKAYTSLQSPNGKESK